MKNFKLRWNFSIKPIHVPLLTYFIDLSNIHKTDRQPTDRQQTHNIQRADRQPTKCRQTTYRRQETGRQQRVKADRQKRDIQYTESREILGSQTGSKQLAGRQKTDKQ